MKKKLLLSVVSISLLLSSGCANQNFQQLGSSLLSSTGLVSGSQADAFFKAGSKIASAAGPLSSEQEYYLGRAVSAIILSKYSLAKNRGNLQYLNSVGNLVAAVSERPETFGGYHFAVIDTEEINALSAPGGFIFVSTGFLRKIKSEEELAAVLAHEVAHVVKGHGVKAISQANLTEGLSILGKEAVSSYGSSSAQLVADAFGNSVNEVVETLLSKGYSRSQEYEADEYAVELLKNAGYDPRGLPGMLSTLKEVSDSKGGWMDTHPSASRRLGNLDDFAEGAVKGVTVRTARFKAAFGR